MSFDSPRPNPWMQKGHRPVENACGGPLNPLQPCCPPCDPPCDFPWQPLLALQHRLGRTNGTLKVQWKLTVT